MDLFVDPTARYGKSRALYDQLREAIVAGRLRTGDRLPTTRSLAEELGVSRSTVTAVYGRLVAEGFLRGRSGAGTVVSFGSSVDRAVNRPSSLAATNDPGGDTSNWSLGGFDGIEPDFDLRTGRPDPALFPLRQWRRVVVNSYNAPPPSYSDPAGIPALRQVIAQWIGRSRGVEAAADQVIVTAGAQQAIDLVSRVLLREGDVVAVEDPGYPPVASLLATNRANVVPVRVDRDGIIVEEIPSNARVVYVTPSHQSPTGVAMTMSRRRALLEFAAANNVAIVEDDYDTEYRHRDRPFEPLYRLDGSGRVIYVGTFSKTLSPSLRLGFAVLPPALVADATAHRSLMDWQPPAASQQALCTFIVDGHLERHLRRTRSIYTERHRIVANWCEEQQQAGHIVEVLTSEAGLHQTAHLAPGLTEQAIRQAAEARRVALGNYQRCWLRTDRSEGIVIGFGAVASSTLPEALALLADAMNEVADRHGARPTMASAALRSHSG